MAFTPTAAQACSNLLGELRADRIGKTDVGHNAVREERGDAAARSIEELVGNDEIERAMFFFQRSHRTERQDAFHAQHLHSVNIGAEVQLRRRNAMAAAMPGKKGHSLALQFSDDVGVRRRAKRRVQLHFLLRGRSRALNKDRFPQ